MHQRRDVPEAENRSDVGRQESALFARRRVGRQRATGHCDPAGGERAGAERERAGSPDMDADEG